jgi:hypothetical protein
MKTGRHKLSKVSGGRPFYADVTVECDNVAAGPVVQVSSDAIDGRYDDWRRAAVRGVVYALHHAEPRPSLDSLGVTVTRILGLDVDTEETAVAAAACHATWEALALAGTHPPRFEGRTIVFDE